MAQSKSTGFFISTPGFCSDCGSILPLLEETGNVECYACKKVWGPEGSYSFCFFFYSFFKLLRSVALELLVATEL